MSSTDSSQEQQVPMMQTADGKEVPVPQDGTLGLLAMGYKGIMLWREARAQSGWTAKKAGEVARAMFPPSEKKGRKKGKADQSGATQRKEDAAKQTENGAQDRASGPDPDAMIPFQD